MLGVSSLAKSIAGMSKGGPAICGIVAPGRRPTVGYSWLIFRRIGVPVLLACSALDAVLALVGG